MLKNNIKRKILSVICVIMLSCLTACQSNNTSPNSDIPVNPVTDFEYKYDAELGGMVITKYIGNTLKVNIPETIENEPVKRIDGRLWRGSEADDEAHRKSGGNFIMLKSGQANLNGAFMESNIIQIHIPNSITQIGTSAFYKCTGLTDIFIPNSINLIPSYAFYDCKGLTEVIITDGVERIGEQSFARCTGLTEIIIPDSINEIGYNAFDGCTNLKSISYKGSTYDYKTISSLYAKSSINR